MDVLPLKPFKSSVKDKGEHSLNGPTVLISKIQATVSRQLYYHILFFDQPLKPYHYYDVWAVGPDDLSDVGFMVQAPF